MEKKILAVLCAIAMVVSTLSVNGAYVKDAKAATGTLHIDTASFNSVLGYKSVSNGGPGYLNINYTGVASDYASNTQNFLDAAFAEKYISYAKEHDYTPYTR